MHANVAMAAWDRRGLERLLRYMARPPLAVERLSVDGQGRVVYRLRKKRRDGAQVLVLKPLEFLARLASLIPPKQAHGLTYHGVFGAAARARAVIVPKPMEGATRCPQPRGKDRGAAEEAATARAPPQAEFEGFDPPWADDAPTLES